MKKYNAWFPAAAIEPCEIVEGMSSMNEELIQGSVAQYVTTTVDENASDLTYHAERDGETDLESIWIVFIILAVVLAVFILGTNTLVLTLIKRTPSLRTPSNYFIISLCVANLLAALTGLPTSLLAHFSKRHSNKFCKSCAYFTHMVEIAAVYSLVAVAYDRFKVIITLSPGNSNTRHSVKVILIVWTISAIYSIRAPFLYEHRTLTFLHRDKVHHVKDCLIAVGPTTGQIAKDAVLVDFVLIFCMPVCLIITFYSIIVFRSRRLQATSGAKVDERQMRVLKIVSCLVVLFVLFNCPLYILDLYIAYGPGPFPEEAIARESFELMLMLNFGMEAIIYALYWPSYRIALGSLMQSRLKLHMQDGVPKSDVESINDAAVLALFAGVNAFIPDPPRARTTEGRGHINKAFSNSSTEQIGTSGEHGDVPVIVVHRIAHTTNAGSASRDAITESDIEVEIQAYKRGRTTIVSHVTLSNGKNKRTCTQSSQTLHKGTVLVKTSSGTYLGRTTNPDHQGELDIDNRRQDGGESSVLSLEGSVSLPCLESSSASDLSGGYYSETAAQARPDNPTPASVPPPAETASPRRRAARFFISESELDLERLGKEEYNSKK